MYCLFITRDVVVCCSVLQCVAVWFAVDLMCSPSYLFQSDSCIVYLFFGIDMGRFGGSLFIGIGFFGLIYISSFVGLFSLI